MKLNDSATSDSGERNTERNGSMNNGDTKQATVVRTHRARVVHCRHAYNALLAARLFEIWLAASSDTRLV